MLKAGTLLVSVGVAGAMAAAGVGSEAPSRNLATIHAVDLASPAPEIESLVRSKMNTSAFSLQRVTAPARPGDAFQTTVAIDGGNVTLDLTPHSVRSSRFRVWVPGEDGELVEALAPASSLYRGTVQGFENSTVTASVSNGQLNAYILLDGVEATPWMVAPLTDAAPGVASDIYVVHRAADSVHGGWTCAVEGHMHDGEDGHPAVERSTRDQDCLLVTEIAFDADFPFYQLNSSSLANTIADIEFIQDNVNIVYERDIGSTFEITDIIVRTSAGADPYSSSNASTLLCQFRNHWNANHTGIQRDIAHLMTGRATGSTIGVAWVGVVCNVSGNPGASCGPFGNLGYGLSQSRFSINTNFRIALTAHEVGHNFSMGHCSGSACHIMCASINGCGGVGNPPIFGATSISTISSYAQNRPCLEEVCFSCTGDIDGDGVVDGTDLGLLLLAWGNVQVGADADLDDSGTVDGTDLGLLLLAWGPCQ